MNPDSVLFSVFDPAIASPVNTLLILGEFAYLVNELAKLRKISEARAEAAMKIARGSEERATRAAAQVEKAVREVLVAVRAADPSRSWPFDQNPEAPK
jgi:hypothetical protein